MPEWIIPGYGQIQYGVESDAWILPGYGQFQEGLAAQSVTGASISSTLQLFAPTIIPEQPVTTAHIASTVVLNAPTLAYVVVVAHISSIVTVNAPSIVREGVGAEGVTRLWWLLEKKRDGKKRN